MSKEKKSPVAWQLEEWREQMRKAAESLQAITREEWEARRKTAHPEAKGSPTKVAQLIIDGKIEHPGKHPEGQDKGFQEIADNYNLKSWGSLKSIYNRKLKT